MTTISPGEQLPFQTPQPAPTVEPGAAVSPEQVERAVTIRDFSLLIALLAIATFFAVRTDGVSLDPRNLSMLAIELSITSVLALGMLLVILPGHIDLSAGSGVGLLGGVAAVLVFEHGWPAAAAMAVAFILGVAIWGAMGSLIVKQNVPAFIITLGGLLVFKGLHWLVIHNTTIPVALGGTENPFSKLTTYYIPPRASFVLGVLVIVVMGLGSLSGYRTRKAEPGVPVDGERDFMQWFVTSQLVLLFVLICNNYRGVPLAALILGMVAFAVYVLTQHTPFGRYLYAIGGNQEAAFVSGVPVDRVVIGAFMIMGFIVALTGLLQTAYAGASTTTVGLQMELDAVAACVIGGVSLRGGRGTVGGVLLGGLFIAILLNGMTLTAASPEMKYIARGVVLALAVWMDVRLTRK
jgi:D-xylose transport system permease protein